MQLEAFDLGFLYFFGNQHRPWLDEVVKIVTHLGAARVLVPIALLTTLFLLRLGKKGGALAVLGALLVAWGLEWGGKWFVHRLRPDVNWRLIDWPTSSSFPSGHALESMCLYAVIALLVASRLKSSLWRWVVISSGIGLGLVVGLSRTYLGVHYPTDVLAGWLAGLACALVAAELGIRWDSAHEKGEQGDASSSAPPSGPGAFTPASGIQPPKVPEDGLQNRPTTQP